MYFSVAELEVIMSKTPEINTINCCISGRPKFLFAFEKAVIRVNVTLGKDFAESIELIKIDSFDSSIKVESASLTPGFRLFPGETYQCDISILRSEIGPYLLSEFFLEFSQSGKPSNAQSFSPGQFFFFPPLPRDIRVVLDPVCSYNGLTKILVGVENSGSHTFENLAIAVEPNSSVISCKTFFRENFPPRSTQSEDQRFEAILIPGPILFRLNATHNGLKYEHTLEYDVQDDVHVDDRFQSKLLEPRRLSRDEVSILSHQSENEVPIRQGYFQLTGGEKYTVLIRSANADAISSIEMKSIPDRLHPYASKYDQAKGAWSFEVEVTYNELFRRPDRIHYDVKKDQYTQTGEIYVKLLPPRLKRISFAGTAGFASTLQGIAVGIAFLQSPEIQSWTDLSEFVLIRDYPLFFLVSIPAIWIVVWLFDVIRDRLRG